MPVAPRFRKEFNLKSRKHEINCRVAAYWNLEFKYYRPPANRLKPSKLRGVLNTLLFFRDTNQRMHNKIITVDGKIAVTGGRNIENTYYHFSTGMNFKDLDVLAIGPVVKQMGYSFEKFWDYRHSVASRKLTDVKLRIEADDFLRYSTRDDFNFNGFFDELSPAADDAGLVKTRFADQLLAPQRVEFICDKPGKNRRWGLNGDGIITVRLRKELSAGERQFVMQSPYLVLDQSAREFFVRLKEKKPGLKLIVSSNSFGSTDNIMAYSANYKWHSLYIEDLELHIYEYKPLPVDLLNVFSAYPEMKALAGDGPEQPFLCIHARSLVIDDRVAYIGTYNLDPRSANLNTEVGLLVYDEKFAALLKEDILNDTKAGNSWVIAKKKAPMSLDKVNAIFEKASSSIPVDIWPVRNTSSFELLPGRDPLPPGHPGFYTRYKDVGSFPGNAAIMTSKETQTRMLKILNGLAAPI